MVLAHWSIRNKLRLCVGLLLVTVSLLALGGVRGIYGYRSMVRSVSQRAVEMQQAFDLLHQVDAMQAALFVERELATAQEILRPDPTAREEFRMALVGYEERLKLYREQLQRSEATRYLPADAGPERQTLEKIEVVLKQLHARHADEDWWLNGWQLEEIRRDLQTLSQLSSDLPGPLLHRMYGLTSRSRLEYRTWILLVWGNFALAFSLLVLLLRLVYMWIFRPLRELFKGSALVAAGDFRHRICLMSRDEMAQLGNAINLMTDRFCEIRDDLDRQVRQRTQEVVRSERLASVGFLAAGVAHEINNPLAAIALCAESLESRLHDIIQADDGLPDAEHNQEITILRHYLRMIQDEAFRCKEITDGLLDFSRLGDVERHETRLDELVRGVIDMVGHLGTYKEKQVRFDAPHPVIVCVNAQEWKQVILNLITNGLDSLDPGGTVSLRVSRDGAQAVLWVHDDGCGMTEEVQQHLFEPFFTRRRGGHGTGLGMSITYRIVTDHGGQIRVSSGGPGRGSEITVTVPLAGEDLSEKERHYARQAA